MDTVTAGFARLSIPTVAVARLSRPSIARPVVSEQRSADSRLTRAFPRFQHPLDQIGHRGGDQDHEPELRAIPPFPVHVDAAIDRKWGTPILTVRWATVPANGSCP